MERFVMEVVAGIDLGGTETKFGLVNREGVLLASGSIPTRPVSDYRAFFDKLCRTLEKEISGLKEEVVLAAIGIGAPTGNNITGRIERAVNLEWPDQVPVAAILSDWFHVPVVVSNDANAAARGELHYGEGVGLHDLVCITLGTGLGCGIISGGRLLTGSGGLAGELGHVTAIPDGRPCSCGQMGCLETYVSATGIVRTVREMDPMKLKNSILGDVESDGLTSKAIADAARQGDHLAQEVFDFTGKILGRALADVVALLNPQRIVITGGVVQAGDLLLTPLTHYLNHYLLHMYKGTVDIKLSSSIHNQTQLLGAAAFAREKHGNIGETSADILAR